MTRLLLLLDDRGRKHLAEVQGAMVSVPGLGTFDASRLELHEGRKVAVGNRAFLVLTPSMGDLRETLEREAQILAPKDLASLLYRADVAPGSRVLEAGCGSGSLTLALARAVGPSGQVLSLDLREEFLATARANITRAGLLNRVRLRAADVREGIPERDLDAVFLDIPDPWAAVPAAWEALRPCGHLASFSPNMEQVKETVMAIGKLPFVDVRTIEIIEREMEVREVGVRPSFAPLGHTGYLTFARKVLETL